VCLFGDSTLENEMNSTDTRNEFELAKKGDGGTRLACPPKPAFQGAGGSRPSRCKTVTTKRDPPAEAHALFTPMFFIGVTPVLGRPSTAFVNNLQKASFFRG
jgi:hypothetical protein